MDTLADELACRGVTARTYREDQWGEVADALESRAPAALVLIGFSYGADDVILISRRLNQKHHRVDLLVTIDPVTPEAVPENVARCVNFFQSNGFWDVFPWLRGVPLRGEPGMNLENINIRNRPDLLVADTSHRTIAGNENIHRAIINLVLKAQY